MSQLLLFGACFALGIISKILYKLETLLCARTRLLAVTIILDFLLVAIIAFGYVAIIFFMCDGKILSYSIAALLLGFLCLPWQKK